MNNWTFKSFEDANNYVKDRYEIIHFNNGHIKNIGKHSGIYKNPYWVINENDKEFILMYCEIGTICKLCREGYDIILKYEDNIQSKITWFKAVNGYIVGNNKIGIHQLIMNCYGNGKGTKNISIDHIDRNPLNNTLENLRIATRKEQEQNSKGIKEGTKRERKHNAKDLPVGITQDMMLKYVVYYHEWLNTEHTKQREFFKVEKHPKLNKIWIGTKSNKVSIIDKLNQANKIVENLENDIYPSNENNDDKTPKLPKYYSLIMTRGKPHLVFEQKVNGKKLNIQMVLPDNYDLNEQLTIIQQKVKDKYSDSS